MERACCVLGIGLDECEVVVHVLDLCYCVSIRSEMYCQPLGYRTVGGSQSTGIHSKGSVLYCVHIPNLSRKGD